MIIDGTPNILWSKALLLPVRSITRAVHCVVGEPLSQFDQAGKATGVLHRRCKKDEPHRFILGT